MVKLYNIFRSYKTFKNFFLLGLYYQKKSSMNKINKYNFKTKLIPIVNLCQTFSSNRHHYTYILYNAISYYIINRILYYDIIFRYNFETRFTLGLHSEIHMKKTYQEYQVINYLKSKYHSPSSFLGKGHFKKS